MEVINSTLAAWERVKLSEKVVVLDQQGLKIADHREEATKGREALKDVIRAFKSTPAEERVDKIGGVVKAFQAEVDALTQRQRYAEDAFLDLYRSLDDAPDPLAALREAVAANKASDAMRAEHEETKKQLANYDKEFTQLTNQAQTIKSLKQQLKEAEARAEEAVATALRQQQEGSLIEQQLLQASAHEREAEMALRLQRSQEEAAAAARVQEAAGEQLYHLQQSNEETQAAARSEIELLRAELERSSAQVLSLRTENETLRRDAAAGSGGAGGGAAVGESAAAVALSPQRLAALEEILAAKELQLTKLTSQLASTERALVAKGEEATQQAARDEAALQRSAVRVRELQAELDKRPTSAAHAEALAQLDALRAAARLTDGAAGELVAAAELGGAGEGGGGGAVTAHVQMLEAELRHKRAQLSEKEAEAEAQARAQQELAAKVEQQQATLAQLEDALLQKASGAAVAPGAAGAGAAAAVPPAGASQANETLSKLLCGVGGASTTASAAGGGAEQAEVQRLLAQQRDRARREAEEVAAENRRLKDQTRGLQVESRKLQADNLKLFEKIRFLQSQATSVVTAPGATGGASGGGAGPAVRVNIGSNLDVHNSIAEEQTEARYRKMYEAELNPFAAFHRREKMQRINELNPAERLMLNFSSFFLANRQARLFLAGYIVCLHVLFSLMSYSLMHHTHRMIHHCD